jgi:uroporphyrinogen-III synthase
MRVMITRPQEDAAPLAESLDEEGIETLLEPLIAIDYKDGPDLDFSNVQALLITSANGLRAFVRRHDGRNLRVFAVGDASARASIAAGFLDVESATGDVEALSALVVARLNSKDGDVLHVSAKKITGGLGEKLQNAGFSYRREVLYEAIPATNFSEKNRTALEKGAVDGVLFYSPRTAKIFAGLVQGDALGGCCQKMVAFCLSSAVAEKVRGLGWRDVIVCPNPDQQAMIKTLRSWKHRMQKKSLKGKKVI